MSSKLSPSDLFRFVLIKKKIYNTIQYNMGFIPEADLVFRINGDFGLVREFVLGRLMICTVFSQFATSNHRPSTELFFVGFVSECHPLVVRIFECVYRSLVFYLLWNVIPRLCSSYVEEILSYFQPCCLHD